jgi:tetratricopeptide (TPR) repeat protein
MMGSRADIRCRWTKGGQPSLVTGIVFLWFLTPGVASARSAPATGSEWRNDPWKAAAFDRIDRLRLASQAESALCAIDSVLPRATAEGDSGFLLQLHLRQGEIRTSAGFAARGEDILRDALRFAELHRDTASILDATRWLSVAAGSLGRPEEAMALSQALFDRARRRGDRRHQGWALVGLAYGSWSRGDNQESIDRYNEAAALFAGLGDARAEAWARNGLGMALSSKGDFEDARAAYLRAALLARESGYFTVEGLAANNLGTLEHALGDPGAAAKSFREALEVHRRMSSPRETIIPSLNVAICESELGRLESSADSLDRLLGRCRASGWRDLEVSLLVSLGDLRMQQQRPRAAARLYRAALTLRSAAGEGDRTEAVIGLAEALSSQDSAAAAVPILRNALREADKSAAPALRARIETALGDCLLRVHDPASAAASFDAAEERARVLGLAGLRLPALVGAAHARFVLGQEDRAHAAAESAAVLWETSRALPLDPEWREERGRIGRKISTQLIRLLLRTESGSPSERAALAYERAQLFKTRTLLERMAGPAGPESVPAFDLERLRRDGLRDRELLLEFFLGPTCSFLFAVRRDSLRVLELPPEEAIETPIRLYRGLLSAPPDPLCPAAPELLERCGQAVRSLLFREVEGWITQDDRVIVATDGILNLLPFGVLPDPESPPAVEAPASRLRSLRQSVHDPPEWIQVPSASVWLRLRERPQGTEEASVAGILALGPDDGALPGARAEAAEIARTYRQSAVRLVRGTDTLRVKDLDSRRLVLHLAGHATVEDERPWRSRIDLGARGPTAAEIALSRTPARLVVLAGCRTADGRVLSGEGVQGLSTAFLSAGASCVVASLWPIDDAATALLTAEFYSELAAGRTVASALSEAQRRIRRQDGTEAPYYWAGLVALGSADQSIPLRERPLRGRTRCRPAAIAAGLSGFMALVALIRRFGRQGRPGSGRRGIPGVIPGPKDRLMG